MHAVIRNYSGKGAKKLIDIVEKNKVEVEKLMRPIKGFVSYSLVRTSKGGFSVTVCKDKAGTEESTRAARDWITKNARDTGAAKPTISEGSVILHLNPNLCRHHNGARLAPGRCVAEQVPSHPTLYCFALIAPSSPAMRFPPYLGPPKWWLLFCLCRTGAADRSEYRQAARTGAAARLGRSTDARTFSTLSEMVFVSCITCWLSALYSSTSR